MKITFIECLENSYPIYNELISELQEIASNISLTKTECPLAEKTHVFVKKAIMSGSDAVIYCIDSRAADEAKLSHLRELIEKIELESGKMCLECSPSYKPDKEIYMKEALKELNVIIKIILDSEGYPVPKEITETKEENPGFLDVDKEKGNNLF